jgi:hypothetical protein
MREINTDRKTKSKNRRRRERKTGKGGKELKKGRDKRMIKRKKG